MKICTLGTSHGNSTLERFNSSTAYVTEQGHIYLVDAGAPCEALMLRAGLRVQDVYGIFLTHMHDDHAGGLSGVVKQLCKYPTDHTVPLYFPQEGAAEAFCTWMGALHEMPLNETISLRLTDDGVIFEDDELRVFAVRTRHLRTEGRTKGTPCSFAYCLWLKKENRHILHTGDLWRDFSDFPAVAAQEHFDVCLCEATHYDPAAAQPLLAGSKFDRLIFVHIADRWHGPAGERELLRACGELPYPVAIAHDGEFFEI